MTPSNSKVVPTLFLASQSPRRAELLRQIAVPFAVVDGEIDEEVRNDESPIDYVTRMAREKVEAGYRDLVCHSDHPIVVLAADTIVVADIDSATIDTNSQQTNEAEAPIGGQSILGKPRDQKHAMSMLKQLSGRSHFVVTAFATIAQPRPLTSPSPQRLTQGLSRTRVRFTKVNETQAKWYWATGEPKGKAGGYAIQGLGAIFVDEIEGSYSGVVGLPLYEVSALLRELGVVPNA